MAGRNAREEWVLTYEDEHGNKQRVAYADGRDALSAFEDSEPPVVLTYVVDGKEEVVDYKPPYTIADVLERALRFVEWYRHWVIQGGGITTSKRALSRMPESDSVLQEDLRRAAKEAKEQE